MIGLLLLKHIYGLSDERGERWVHDLYFQYFTGEEFFQHAFLHKRSDLSHWRKRLGDKPELLLAESLRVVHEAGALPSQDFKRVTVDTAVQPKAITFPTNVKLLHAAINGLNRLARKHGVKLRQSYLRIAKTAAMMAGRYAHAKQFKRHQRQFASCAAGWAGSSAISAARSKAWPYSRTPSPSRSAGFPDPLAAAAPARLKAVFLPCFRGRVQRQGQSSRALRVRCQSLHRHQQPPGSRRPVRAACQCATR
ncbi:hypothetical protein ACVILK_003447 [Bradyrhizobium embrapense]